MVEWLGLLMTSSLSPIIVTGCRRSGTTLLNTILERHPDLLVHPNEPQFFLELFQMFGKQITNLDQAITHVTEHPYCSEAITKEGLSRTFPGVSAVSLQEFAQIYLQIWGGQGMEKTRPVIKHPALILYLDLVFYLFPGAKIIHLVRNPHANISSQRIRWPSASLWECIGWWRDAARAGHELFQNQPEICFELSYENLVNNPEEQLHRLCDFLDIPFSEKLLDFDLQKRIYSPGEEKTGNPMYEEPLKKDAWKQALSPVEVALIERECNGEMAWWGYDAYNPKVSTTKLVGRTIGERLLFLIKTAVRRVKRTDWRG
ncbi:MAG: sulfotransferase [Anaerolineae bacterium]|nr:sulfotransferase [Anaerolineae bacterium]